MKLSTSDLGNNPLPRPLIPARAVRAIYNDRRALCFLAASIVSAKLEKQVGEDFLEAVLRHEITAEDVKEAQEDLGRAFAIASCFGVKLPDLDNSLVNITSLFGGKLAVNELLRGLDKSTAKVVPSELIRIRMIDALLGHIGNDPLEGGPETPSMFDHDDDEAIN